MTTAELEQRVAALEKKIESLTGQDARATNKDWLLKVWGSFANDPDFEEAMRYGRKWRESENRKSLRARKTTPSRNRRK
jgi:hypothetical protein